MCAKRKLAAFLLVLLVASCYVWAFPGRKEMKSEQIQAEPISEALISTENEALKENSEQRKEYQELKIFEKTNQNELNESIAKYEEKTSVKGDDLDELIDLLKSQAEDQLEAERDIERLLKENDELISRNNAQADEIAYNQGLLEKANSVKGFAKLRAVMGFKDKLPTWGIGGELGMKTKQGFILSAGADYMIGSFSSPLSLGWNLDNLSLSLGVGWEW